MLELKNLCKDYYVGKKPVPALKNINLFFPKSGFVAILGHSGCGKTTLLNIIGGLDKATDGDLEIEGISTQTYKDNDWDNYRNKRIGFVFQSYNLINHLSILTNVELSLIIQGVKRGERRDIAKKTLRKVGLGGSFNKKPNQMSGGQCQRVAIARALVNDPEIILADEPTGALDSKTSVQVMEVLKEISKDKLVIMVTHNEEAAQQYADRIITFKDGEVEHDTKNNEPERKAEEDREYHKLGTLRVIDEKEKLRRVKHLKREKSKLDIRNALKLALANMFNKKGRTILTSLGSSFGIIGVALVLALSNGFSSYVSKLEGETASSLPINISTYSITSATTTTSTSYNVTEAYPDDEEIYPYIPTSTTTTYEYKYNNFSNKYFNYLDYLRDELDLMNDYVVNYNSNYQYHLVTEFPESLDGETEATVSEVSTSTSSSTSSVNSVINSYTGLPTNIFHTLYGQEEYVMQNYSLISGRYPESTNELVLVVDTYNRVSFNTLRALGFYSSSDTAADVVAQIDEEDEDAVVSGFSFEDVLGKKYKIFTNDEFYTRASAYISEEFKGYIYFENDIDEIYEDEEVGIEMEVVGILRQNSSSTLTLMTEGLCYLPSFQQTIVENNQGTQIVQDYYKNVSLKSGYSMEDFVRNLIEIVRGGDISTSTIYALFNEYFDLIYFYSLATTTISSFLSYCRYLAIDLVPSSLKSKLISTDESSLSYFIYYIISKVLLETNPDTQIQALLGLMGYINTYSDISSVIVFPKDLTSKDTLLEYLDEYNDISKASGPNDPYHATSTSEQIYYTDIVGTVTSTLAQVINVITVVLVLLAAVSLIVSSVLTGLITYASVIERTREIGILRSIGSRKNDISKMFESESIAVGLIAGMIGCLVAYLATFPINAFINNLYPSYNVGSLAQLNWWIVITLIIVSSLLTFFAGFVPSRMAANKKPVEALRNE